MNKLAVSNIIIKTLVISCFMHVCAAFSPVGFKCTSHILTSKHRHLAMKPSSISNRCDDPDLLQPSMINTRGNHDLPPQRGKITSSLLSLSVVVGCRRLSFLVLSIALVNTFRTTILKVNLNMNDMATNYHHLTILPLRSVS